MVVFVDLTKCDAGGEGLGGRRGLSWVIGWASGLVQVAVVRRSLFGESE